MSDKMPILRPNVDGSFSLVEDFQYTFPWTERKPITESVLIPAGTRTNFASIPGIARAVISPIDKDIIVAAIVHDYLVSEFGGKDAVVIKQIYDVNEGRLVVLTKRQATWVEAAKILVGIMKAEGAPYWKQFWVYCCVRTAGLTLAKKHDMKFR